MNTKTTKTRAPKAAKATMSPELADKIVTSKATANGRGHYVESAGGDKMTFPTDAWSGKLRDLSVVGGSFAAAKAEFGSASVATMARGLTTRAAPQSAKAVADARSNAGAKAAPAAKAAPKAAPKAKAAKTAPADDQRKLSLSEKGEAKLAKLSAADRKKDRLQLMAGAGTVAKAIALANVSIGDVNYAIRTGVLNAA